MEQSAWREWYEEYLQQTHWVEFSAKIREEQQGVCERCSNSGTDLGVHHLHYRTF